MISNYYRFVIYFGWLVIALVHLSTVAIAQNKLPDSVQNAYHFSSPSPLVPNESRSNQFFERMRKELVFPGGDLPSWLHFIEAKANSTHLGEKKDLPQPLRANRPLWIIAVTGLLLSIASVLRFVFPADVSLIVRAYYNQSLLSSLNKEESVFSSWPYVFFFLLFGFGAGLLIYLSLLSGVFGVSGVGTSASGAISYLLISVFVMVLFGLKIITIRFLGFVFDSVRMLRRYITILYLAYFNAGIIFFLTAICISLLPFEYAAWLLWIGLILVALPLLVRLIYVTYELLVNYRFPKFYLIVYLCTLEIAPVLILIKVLYR